MAKKKNKIKIFILIFLTIFILCPICIFLGIYLFSPTMLFRLYEFGLNTRAYAKYYFNPYPSNEWVYCDRIEDIKKYLENEKLQKISFCNYVHEPGNPSDERERCGEVIDSEKINLTLKLIYSGRIDGYIGALFNGRINITTDKHKFTVPFDWGVKDIYSYRWRSAELRKKLWEWGVGPENIYVIPPKEQVYSILLYHHNYPSSHLEYPVAIFGDKILAEEFLFRVGIDKDGKNIMSKNSKKLISKKIFLDRDWLDKIMDTYRIALQEAQKRGRYFPEKPENSIGKIVFMTQDGNYWKDIGIDANTVYDDYIKSEQLKNYFDELGLTEDLLASQIKGK